jgi:hypothetical protein
MNKQKPVLDQDQINEICQSAFPDHAHRSLTSSLIHHYPEVLFSVILSQGGWYRTGGAITAKGEKITNNLVQWAYNEGEKDFMGLLEYCREAGLLATRVDGKIHYIVAPYGPRASDFVQIEVEETQEMLDRPLYGRRLPLDIEDFIDPIAQSTEPSRPLGPPRYRLKQLTYIADLFANVQKHEGERVVALRLMQDWDRSSAVRHHTFCHHWVFELQSYTGHYDEKRSSVRPVSTYSQSVPRLVGETSRKGPKLANLIRHFDHRLRYPMAWYFYLLTRNLVSAEYAQTVCDDHDKGYAYLPERDLQIVKDWLENPYLH